jgi:hypothetical protein
MQAVKALYKEGHIQLLEPLQGVTEAELFVIVLDKNEQTGNVGTTFSPIEVNSEQEFKSLGLASFFDTNEDNHVDWEEMFDVKSR